MFILLQFVYRLSFGLALAMAITPARGVTSGYYRHHSYVLLGLTVLAGAVSWFQASGAPMWPAIAGAILSYVASATWLYEKPRPGIVALALIAATSICGAWLVEARLLSGEFAQGHGLLAWLDPLSGGLVLGGTMAAMLLGHWYLHAPGMKLAPLQRLGLLLTGAL